MVDGAPYAVPLLKADLGEVAVVYVAGEHDYGSRGASGRTFSRADGPQKPREIVEGSLEGTPVFKGQALPAEVADPRRRTAPGAPADGCACGLEGV